MKICILHVGNRHREVHSLVQGHTVCDRARIRPQQTGHRGGLRPQPSLPLGNCLRRIHLCWHPVHTAKSKSEGVIESLDSCEGLDKTFPHSRSRPTGWLLLLRAKDSSMGPWLGPFLWEGDKRSRSLSSDQGDRSLTKGSTQQDRAAHMPPALQDLLTPGPQPSAHTLPS